MSPSTEPDHGRPVYQLLLFVCGDEPNSTRARKNLEWICATDLEGSCDVQIIDVLEDYRSALEHRVLVTPCLVKLEPRPRALVAGTLNDANAVRDALQLPGRRNGHG